MKFAAKKKTATPSNVIQLPKVNVAKSFNMDRLLKGNELLRNQVEHFHKMEQEYPEHLRSGVALKSIRTEGQAAEFIRRATVLFQSRPEQRTKKQGN